MNKAYLISKANFLDKLPDMLFLEDSPGYDPQKTYRRTKPKIRASPTILTMFITTQDSGKTYKILKGSMLK